MKRTFALGLIALALLPGTASAVTLTGILTPTGDADFNLTTLGTSDWAYWNTSANPATGIPTNEKAGGTLISNITPVGGGGVRGSSAPTQPVYDFIFTDGTAPVAGTVNNATGLFNTQLDMDGAGVSLNVLLPTTDDYQVTLFLAGFAGTGQLTASLPGAILVDSSFTFGAGAIKDSYYYTFLASPDNPGDLLNFSFILTSGTANSHVLFSGVAVSALAAVIPEPATLTLAAMGIVAVGCLRRRRRSRA